MPENKKPSEAPEAAEVNENELEDVAGGIWRGPDSPSVYPPGTFHTMGNQG